MSDRIEAIIDALRKKLLDAAVRGELVDQDNREEPASALLERIAAERSRLIREKKIKKPKSSSRIERRDGHFYESVDGSTPVCIDDELPFEIPDSWEWVRGRDIFLPIENRVPDQNFTYIDIDAINNKEHIIENPKELSFKSAPSRARRVIRKNDVLFSLVRPYLENIALVTEDGDNLIASTGFFVARSAQGIDYRYTFYLLTSPYVVQGLNTYMKGDNSPSIHGTHVENYLYPLPPATEQHRIVDALERQLKQLDILRESHRRMRRILHETPTSLRQQLLQASIEGKLVAQDPKEEPASALLERIAKERTALPGKRKAAPSSRIERRPNGIFELFPDGSEKDISDEIPFDIPERWEWVRLSSLGTIVGGGTPSTSDASLWDGDVPWITPADMKELKGKYVSHGSRYISPEGVQKSSTKELPAGSVVFSSRAPIGYVAIAKNTIYTNQGFKSVVFTHSGMSDYVYYSLIGLTDSIKQRASGTTFAEISGREFGKTLISLPPLQEQQRIVQRLEELLSLVSQA